MPVAHGLEYGSHRDIAALAFAYLHKESLDIYNRLHSIEEDVAFVTSVCSSYPHLPVLPNLRCGAWYVDPSTARREPAYFKSTDGHYGNWSFNLRRPNLHLLQVALSEGGLIIVDSTRSGKRIPDALSKTVPIWCTVVNRAIRSLNPMTQKRQWDTALCCPPGVVSSQEMAQIEERIDGWVDSLLASSYVLPDLAFPLKPLWITPSTTVLPQVTSAALRNYLPVICVSASRSMSEGLERRRNGFAYVPGSGDDHELWGVHKTVILKAIRSDLPTLVGSLVKESPSRSRNDCWTLLPTPIFQVGGSILVGAISDLPLALPSHLPESGADIAFVLISGNSTSEPLDDPGFDAPGTVLQLRLSEGKKEQLHFLRNVLPKASTFIGFQLARKAQVCICCDSGKDASAGIALAALQLFFDDAGNFTATAQQQAALRASACKQSVRTRLQWIISSRPQVNPSRVTLKRVNEFILSSPDFRRQR